MVEQERQIPRVRQTWPEIFQPRLQPTRHEANQETRNEQRQGNTVIIENAESPAGDEITECVNKDTLRIYFQNIDGVKIDEDMTWWHLAMNEMNDRKVGVFGFAETNIAWDEQTRQKCKQITNRVYKRASINLANVRPWPRRYQPGGTCIGVTGKWSTRILEQGQDKSGMARWAYVTLGGKDTKLTIISAYRVCQKQIAGTGSSTAYMQQWSKLRKMGHTNPNPRNQFIEDMSRQINEWKSEGHEIVFMADMNEKWGADNIGVANIAVNTGLGDIQSETHGLQAEVPTYCRSQKRIDYILTTPNVIKCVTKCGIERLNAGIISDHKGMYLDINFKDLMKGELKESSATEGRKIISTRPTVIQKYKDKLQEHLKANQVWDRLAELIDNQTNNSWNEDETKTLIQIDETITKGMLAAEAKAGSKNNLPWSVELMQATMTAAYWRLSLRGSKTNRNYATRLLEIAKKAHMSEESRVVQNIQEISVKLRQANAALRIISKNASSNREAFLMERINACYQVSDEKKAKILENLLRAKNTAVVFKKLRAMIKGSGSGALSYILIPKPYTGFPYDPNTVDEWEAVYDQARIQELIIGRNIVHFGQAQGTPMTNEPIKTIIKPGMKLHEIDKEAVAASNTTQAAKDIIESLEINNEPISATLDIDEMKAGYKNWRETTTTSPSRRHLSHYHALLQPDGTPKENCDEKSNEIWKIHVAMFNATVGAGISLPRWWRVENVMIEKIQGTPRLDKLRVIHILEADYNLALKMIWSRRAMMNLENNRKLGESQWGGRAGRSTIDVLIMKMMKYDTSARARIMLALLENDAKACYDRMVVNLASAISQAYGVPHSACKAISDTLTNMMYHVKTSAGVSEGAYSHSLETPVHGIGQGAGWSGPVWTFHTDTMVKLMDKQANGFTFDGPRSNMKRSGTMEGFVDDMNAAVNSWDETINQDQLLDKLQHDTQKWTDFIHATGGKLELTKTYYQLYGWNHDEQGNYSPEHCELPNMTVKCPETNARQRIKTKRPEIAQETLGVMIAPNNDQKEQIKKLREKSEMILRGVTSGQASKFSAILAENHIYVPAMCYSFPVTMIPDITLKSIQEPATRVFLSLQGMNPNFPRQVVYGPKELAGFAKKNLPNEQAVANIYTIFQQHRRSTQSGLATKINLAWIQQEAGTREGYLQNPSKTITYVNDGLVPQIRRSLQKAKCSLWSERTQDGMRDHDSFLMDRISPHFSKTKLKIINNWRLYLQVEKISDIATADGKEIDICWFQRYAERTSASTIRWPAQIPPANRYWSTWTAALRIIATNQVLREALSEWTVTKQESEREYKQYIDHTTNDIYQVKQEGIYRHTSTMINRRTLRINDGYRVNQMPITLQPAQKTSENTVRPSNPFNYRTESRRGKQKWETDLLHGEIQTLNADQKQTISNETSFKITSSALFDDKWAYGWSIETSTETISDYGIMPLHPDYSAFTAFAYGILTAATIIHRTKENLQECTIEIRSEDKTVADRFQKLTWHPTPIKLALKPGSDVAIGAIKILDKAKITCTHHITKEGEATPQGIRQAVAKSKHRRIGRMEAKEFNFITPGGPYLLMNNEIITNGHKTKIRDELSRQPLIDYIIKKNRWNQNTYRSVDWHIHKTALQKLTRADQKIITRYIHRWMPTGAYVARMSAEHDARCPLCMGQNEQNNHFLQCRHASIIERRDKMLRDLKNHAAKASITRLGWYHEAILLWTRNANPNILPITHPHRQIYVEQEKIGWHNITRGRIPKSMTAEIRRHFEHRAYLNPEQQANKWLAKHIYIIWEWVTDTWRFRCNAQHGKVEGALITPQIRINQRIQACYDYKNNLPWHDRRQFQKTLQEMLDQTKFQQETWLLILEPLIEGHRDNINATLPGYHDIRNFFR